MLQKLIPKGVKGGKPNSYNQMAGQHNYPSLIYDQSITLAANVEYVYDTARIAGLDGNGILVLDFVICLIISNFAIS